MKNTIVNLTIVAILLSSTFLAPVTLAWRHSSDAMEVDSLKAMRERSELWIYLADIYVDNYVDVDEDGYYRSVDFNWNADVDQYVNVDVYVEFEGYDSAWQFLGGYGIYTIYDMEVDYKSYIVTVPRRAVWDLKIELYSWDTIPELVDDWVAYDIPMETAEEDEPVPDLQITSLECPSKVTISEGFSLNVGIQYSLTSATGILVQVYEHGGPLLDYATDTLSGSGSETYPLDVTASSTPTPDWQLNVHLFYWDVDEWNQTDFESIHIEVVSEPVEPVILLLVNENIYSDIKSDLMVFEQDLRNERYWTATLTVADETSPPEIKEKIRSYYYSVENLVGVILIGNINAAYCEIHTGDFSNPEEQKIWISLDAGDMYYMDLDGHWDHVADPDFCEDAPPYVTECYTYSSCETFKNEYIVYPESEEFEWDYSVIEDKEQFKAEIWVSRVMAHNLDIPDKSEVQIISDFFEWDHTFRTGMAEVSSLAYLLAAWAEEGPCPYQCMNYSEIFDTVVHIDEVTRQEYLACLGDCGSSRLLYLGAHSWPQGHALYDTQVTTDDLLNENKTSIFYILNACSSCRWDHSVSSPDDPNYLGGLYVFDTSPVRRNYGLGAIGFTGVGGFNWLEYFTDYLNDNPPGTYGEAYKYWFNENLMHIFGPWNYVFLGDPTIGPCVSVEPQISIHTDKTEYTPGDTMYLGLDVTNADGAMNVCFAIWVVRPGDSIYLYLHMHDIILPAEFSYSNPAFRTITLPNLEPGTYTWHAALLDPTTHTIIVEDTAEWEFK